jgi:hypothetical protein
MSQTSTTISGQKTHKVNITVTEGASFLSSAGTYKISTSSTSLANLAVRDLITITGSTSNNGTYTVKSVAADGLSIFVEEQVTTESADGSTDTVIDYVGFVTDKYKGDGYYSQTDGVHTVAYHVSAGSQTAANNFNGKIKMQASLATTPTEDDWFDIENTIFTADLSTKVSSYTFTGNFVWVRAKAFDQTNLTSSVEKILYNN